MTIIKEWCDGRKEKVSLKEVSRMLSGTYGSAREIWDLLSHGEILESCAATYYEVHYFANAQENDPRVNLSQRQKHQTPANLHIWEG